MGTLGEKCSSGTFFLFFCINPLRFTHGFENIAVIQPVLSRRFFDLILIIHIPEGRKRYQRRMWELIGTVEEKWSGRIFSLNLRHHLFGYPVGGMRLFIQMPGSCIIGVIAHSMQKFLSQIPMFTQPDLIIIHSSHFVSSFFG